MFVCVRLPALWRVFALLRAGFRACLLVRARARVRACARSSRAPTPRARPPLQVIQRIKGRAASTYSSYAREWETAAAPFLLALACPEPGKARGPTSPAGARSLPLLVLAAARPSVRLSAAPPLAAAYCVASHGAALSRP